MISNNLLRINTVPMKLNIDRRDMYASMGLYMPDDFRQKTVSESKQIVLDAIGRTGEDWRSIGETQGATFADICLKNSGWYPVELTQNWIPNVKPNITISQWNKVNIEYIGNTLHDMKISSESSNKINIKI